jgi:hypothetical protein
MEVMWRTLLLRCFVFLLLLLSSGEEEGDEGEEGFRRNGLVRACRHDGDDEDATGELKLLLRRVMVTAEKDSVRDAIEARMKKMIIVTTGEDERNICASFKEE